ncbi:MAG: amidohydrolase family protein [Planctomycetota bacterium]
MARSTNRRIFLQQSAAASLAASGILLSHPASAGAQEAAASGKSELPIIDTHQHLWDLSKFRLPWLADAPALKQSYVTKDYLEAVAGLNVAHAVYMEVDVTPEQQVEEAEHLIALCKDPKNLTVGAVISGRPASEQFKAYISRFRGSSVIKGVRQVLHGGSTPAGTCLSKEYITGVRLLGELGMSFDLCMRPTELADGAKLADECPDTRFIVDHCGNADPKAFTASKQRPADEKPSHEVDPWKRDIEALAKRPNVICKISGIVARARPKAWSADDLAPIVNHCLDAFGPNRVIFGSDWPVCTLVASLREWVVALRSIIASRPVAEQKKLLSENAQRFYSLSK